MAKQQSIQHLRDLTPDPKNARRHTPRNIGMVESALREVGAARSIVIDEDGVVLAGNGVVEAAASAGIEKVHVVEADGNTIIAVRRTGLTAAQKTKLALFDNRTSELADWNPAILAELDKETDLKSLWSEDEFKDLLNLAPNVEFKEYDESVADGISLCKCAVCGNEHARKER